MQVEGGAAGVGARQPAEQLTQRWAPALRQPLGVEDVEDPLMQKIRYLDKLVDELARGKAMEKVLRS